MQDYKIEKGKIHSETGLPYAPRWFCDGRVAFQADNNGIGDIDYFNARTRGHYKVFHPKLWGGMRFYLCRDRYNYILTPQKCELLPYGYASEMDFGDVRCSFSVFTAQDSLFFRLETGNDFPQEYHFKLEFYNDYCLEPLSNDKDLRYKSHIPRTWSEWELKDNVLINKFAEADIEVGVAIGSNMDFTHLPMPRNGKHKLIGKELSSGTVYTTVLSFGTSAEDAKVRCIDTVEASESILEKIKHRYLSVIEKAPVLESGNADVDAFFALAPLYHESLKVPEIPGAIRAQSTHYWVWGWDSMTTSDAVAYWGDRTFLEEMASCLRLYSDEEGIAHAFSRDMKNGGAAAAPAQGMYIAILHLIQAHGGDISAHYPFAKKMFEKILATEKDKSGLCKGTSLYPDFRNLINETGNDISTFNNTVGYCAVRSFAALAEQMGDHEAAAAADEFAARTEQNIGKLFNQKLSFFDSSIEADTGEMRNCPSNNAVKWENNYCDALTYGFAEKCLSFYENELISPAGIRPYPVWSEAYDADSNQLSCWWSVMSEFYTRLANRFDRPDLLNQWSGWIAYWTRRLMCPEGIVCYADNPNRRSTDGTASAAFGRGTTYAVGIRRSSIIWWAWTSTAAA